VVSKRDNPGASDIPCDPRNVFEAIQNLFDGPLAGSIVDANAEPGMIWLRQFDEGSITDEIKRGEDVIFRTNSHSHMMRALIHAVTVG
jgi:hypothetical protein